MKWVISIMITTNVAPTCFLPPAHMLPCSIHNLSSPASLDSSSHLLTASSLPFAPSIPLSNDRFPPINQRPFPSLLCLLGEFMNVWNRNEGIFFHEISIHEISFSISQIPSIPVRYALEACYDRKRHLDASIHNNQIPFLFTNHWSDSWVMNA